MGTGLLRLCAIVLLLVPLLLADAGRALACSCLPASPEEMFRGVTVVFAGTVVVEGESAGRPAEFRVSRVWKGDGYATRFVDVGGVATADGRVTVTSCDPQFDEGEPYLVYATSGGLDKPVRTSACAIRHLEYAQEHLAVLGAGRAPEPGTIATLRAQQTAWSVSLAAIAGALGVLGVVAVRRRRRHARPE